MATEQNFDIAIFPLHYNMKLPIDSLKQDKFRVYLEANYYNYLEVALDPEGEISEIAVDVKGLGRDYFDDLVDYGAEQGIDLVSHPYGDYPLDLKVGDVVIVRDDLDIGKVVEKEGDKIIVDFDYSEREEFKKNELMLSDYHNNFAKGGVLSSKMDSVSATKSHFTMIGVGLIGGLIYGMLKK